MYRDYKWLQISCLGETRGSNQYLPLADMLLSFLLPCICICICTSIYICICICICIWDGESSQYLPLEDMLLSFFSPRPPLMWHVVSSDLKTRCFWHGRSECYIWLLFWCVYCGWTENVMDVYIAFRFRSSHFTVKCFHSEPTWMWNAEIEFCNIKASS